MLPTQQKEGQMADTDMIFSLYNVRNQAITVTLCALFSSSIILSLHRSAKTEWAEFQYVLLQLSL